VQPGSHNESVDLELTESMHEVRVGTPLYKYTSDGKNKHIRVFSVKCKGAAIHLCWRPSTFLSVSRKKVRPPHEFTRIDDEACMRTSHRSAERATGHRMLSVDA
jgi:hypothetical protein